MVTRSFSFSVNNSYSYYDPDANMTDVTVTAEIYMYATEDEAREVNDSFARPPLINGESLQIVHVIPWIGIREKAPVTFDIETSDGTATTADGDYTGQSLTGQTIPEGSSSYGFSVEIPYYWALAPDYDITFSPRITASTRLSMASGIFSLRM